MSQKVRILGLIIGLILLKLFGAAAEYDPSVENSNPPFIQVYSIPIVDNSLLSSSPDVASLTSSTGSTISQPSVINAVTESVIQSIVTNTNTSMGNPPARSDTTTILKPLISRISSTLAPTQIALPLQSSLTSSSSPSNSSSTSVNFAALSENHVPSITNYFSSSDNSVVLTGNSDILFRNSAPSTEDYTTFTGNSVSSIGNSVSSTGNSAPTIGNYISSTGNYVSNNENYASPSANYASSNSKFLSDTASEKTNLYFNNENGISSHNVNDFSRLDNFQFLNQESIQNQFSKAALSVPIIQNSLNYELPGSTAADVLFNVAFKLLKDFGSPNPGATASIVSKDANSLEALTIPLYFQVAGNAITKFLLSEGIVVLPNHSQSYSFHIENALKSTDVNNIESVYQAFSDGFVNFIQSLGFNVVEKADVLAQLFNTELTALK